MLSFFKICCSSHIVQNIWACQNGSGIPILLLHSKKPIKKHQVGWQWWVKYLFVSFFFMKIYVWWEVLAKFTSSFVLAMKGPFSHIVEQTMQSQADLLYPGVIIKVKYWMSALKVNKSFLPNGKYLKSFFKSTWKQFVVQCPVEFRVAPPTAETLNPWAK